MSRSVLIVLGIFLALNLASGKQIKYNDYHVFKVTPEHRDEVTLLSDWEGASADTIYLNSVQTLGKSMYIAVAPNKSSEFQKTLNHSKIEFELVHKNMQKGLDAKKEMIAKGSNAYNWYQYQTLRATYSWLSSLASKYPNHVKLVMAGSTAEQRKIKGIKVSYQYGNKGIFLEGGMHAREWISPATVTYILNELLTSEDPHIRKLAESYDWYVFPHTNPDGYVYSYTTDRLWKKTRSSGAPCKGADPNRNWDFHWMETSASSNPCSDAYAGAKAFSEMETLSLSKYIQSLQGKIHMYVSFHSCSQLLLYPYGQGTEPHTLHQAGGVTAETLDMGSDNSSSVVGDIYKVLYPGSGASVDWAYGDANIPLTFYYELRPTSDDWDGFLISAEHIIPTGQGTLDSLIALINEAQLLGEL